MVPFIVELLMTLCGECTSINLVDGFTKKYKVHKLVWYEDCYSVESALEREKDIKRWYRRWKLELIEGTNPSWEDLYEKLVN